MKKFFCAIAVITFLGGLVEAKEKPSSCYDQAPHIQTKLASLLPDEIPDQVSALQLICKNLGKTETFRVGKRWESTQDEIDGGKILLDLQSLTTQKNFLSDIDKIKKESSLAKRLQLAYRRAIKAVGDFDLKDLKISKGILEEMKIFGARGWDAQRAAFIAYAISSILQKKDQVSVRVIAANLEKGSSSIQTWIQLRLPNKQIVDLDPAESGIFFIPLFPRRIGLEESVQTAALNECPKLNLCLRQQFVSKVGQ